MKIIAICLLAIVAVGAALIAGPGTVPVAVLSCNSGAGTHPSPCAAEEYVQIDLYGFPVRSYVGLILTLPGGGVDTINERVQIDRSGYGNFVLLPSYAQGSGYGDYVAQAWIMGKFWSGYKSPIGDPVAWYWSAP